MGKRENFFDCKRLLLFYFSSETFEFNLWKLRRGFV